MLNNYIETERQLKLSKNGIICLNRGDTFTLPVHINLGSGVHPYYVDDEGELYKTYILRKHLKVLERNPQTSEPTVLAPDDGREEHYDSDHLYFALLEPGQKWEEAIVKKAYWANDIDPITKTVMIHFYPEDTEYLKPGNYYYQIKLQRCSRSTKDGYEHIDTVVPRTKFVILE